MMKLLKTGHEDELNQKNRALIFNQDHIFVLDIGKDFKKLSGTSYFFEKS